jgi:hypothetical protein
VRYDVKDETGRRRWEERERKKKDGKVSKEDLGADYEGDMQVCG